MRASWVLVSAVFLSACGGSSGEFSIDLGGNRLEVKRGSTAALAVTLLADERFEDEVTVRAAVTPDTVQASGGLAFADQTFPKERSVRFDVPIDPAMPAGSEFDIEVVALSAEHRATAQMRVVVKDAGGAPDPSFADGKRAMSAPIATDDSICAMAPATAQLTVFAAVEAGEYVLRAFDGTGGAAAGFGTGGVVHTGLQASSFGWCSLLRDVDGGLVLVGHLAGDLVFLSRYVGRSGALDTTYGSSGITTLQTTGGRDVPVHAVAHPGGGAVILASALVTIDQALRNVLVLLRVNQEGDPVSEFGINGRAVYPHAPIGYYARVAVMTDTRLLVARTDSTDPMDVKLVLERFHSTGSLDETYGGGAGRASISYGGNSVAPSHLLVQADGKVLVGSSSWIGPFDLRRFSSEGAVDTSFGTVGVVHFTSNGSYPNASIWGLALDPSGRIVAEVDYGLDSADEARLVRLLPDGTFDATFGGGRGQYTLYKIPLTNSDWLRGVSVLSDGRIVTVGQHGSEAGRYYFATRTLP